MGYLVLARKWRPQTFDDVVGQEHIVRTLKNTIASGRIAHAYIFGGQRGVGKTSVARIFAKALNCVEGPTETPCNNCVNCREISDGISIDCREIDGASNRGIDEIRELKENIRFAPISSRYKINIIDEVHMLSREAFNALLKTLEEPPEHVIFIFATTEIRKVPATIMSRCQHYDFRRVSVAQITESLEKIAAAEAVAISAEGLRMIAEAGDGSMRDAQSIFDQIISYAGKEIADDKIEGLLGLWDKKMLFAFSDAVFSRAAALCFSLVEEAYYAGVDIPHFYQILLQHFRKLMLAKVLSADKEIAGITAEERKEYEKRVGTVTVETLQRHIDILLLEEENIARGNYPRLTLEMALLRMALLEPLIPVDAVLERLDAIENGLRQASAKSAGSDFDGNKKAPTILVKTAAHPPKTMQIDAGAWRVFRSALKEKNGGYHRWLGTSEFVGLNDGEMTIAVEDNAVLAERASNIIAETDFAKMVTEFFGMPLRLRLVRQEAANTINESSELEDGNNKVSEKEIALLMETPVMRKIAEAYPNYKIVEIRRQK